MPVTLLDSKNQTIGVYPKRLVEILERRQRLKEAIAALDRLPRERRRLLCECSRTLRVVQREYPFLRRNPGQCSDGVECGLCEAARDYEVQSASASSSERAGVSLILATRNHPEGSEEEKEVAGRHSIGSG